MVDGTVKWFNNRKGYGFITPDESAGLDSDVFVHYSNIQGEEAEFKSLNEGDKVAFEIEETPKGPQAVTVTVTEAAPRQNYGYGRDYGASYSNW